MDRLIHFVINPNAGNGKARKAWKAVEPLLAAKGIAYRPFFTRSSKEGAELVRAWAANREDGTGESPALVVAVGGDGSLQGLLGAASSYGYPIGLIPAGSGNDLARSLGIPLDPAGALDRLLGGREIVLDVLLAGGEAFGTVVGIGLDGRVSYETNRSPLKRVMNRVGLGSVAYVLQLLKVLVAYRPSTLELVVDGESHRLERTWLVAVGNSRSYGGGMRICPSADPTDGLLDVTIVQRMSKPKFLWLFPSVYAGTHVHQPGVTTLRGKQVSVARAEGPLYVHGDGEWLDLERIEVEIRPAAVRVIV